MILGDRWLLALLIVVELLTVNIKTFFPQLYNNINMTKHTFLFVIACVLFEWKRICVDFLSFVSICRWFNSETL
jgi:hypothetical protein